MELEFVDILPALPQKKLFILRGLPGSGKSTWAKQYKKDNPDQQVVIASFEDYFLPMGISHHCSNPKSVKNAYNWCRQVAADGMATKKVVIFDNTNINKKDFDIFLRYGRDYGYTVEIITVGKITSSACLEYFARNKKGISLERIIGMKNNFEE